MWSKNWLTNSDALRSDCDSTHNYPTVGHAFKAYVLNSCGSLFAPAFCWEWGGWVDPFANNHSRAEHTNDLNPDTTAKSHTDAVEFLKGFESDSMNGVLLDPPYSMHQCTVSYEGYGTKRVNSLTPVYDEAARITKPDGYILSFGWNSNGVGAGRSFELIEVVLIPHGGHHNDTIVTVERKLRPIPQLKLLHEPVPAS